jgi:hypothetical protein
MDGVKVSDEDFLLNMRVRTEAMLRGVMEAVNAAPDGSWINASEMPVRELFKEFERAAYETALQMKAEATEGAFSPGGPSQRKTNGRQGT